MVETGSDLGGHEQVIVDYVDLWRGDFSKLDVLAGDGVVMWESTVTGTHEGEFYGIPPTGRGMTVSGMSKTLIADDRVQEDRIYYDSREMSEQLGHTEG